jgi:NAD+ synthase (glutamine-hydrolysing)
MESFRLALAQINPTVGALAANRARILAWAEKAAAAGARLVVFPELALCGYPPEDLVLRPHFVEACRLEVEKLAEDLPRSLIVLVGLPLAGKDRPVNAAAVIADGKVAAHYAKRRLPNYGVFDEQRIFEAGERPLCIQCRGLRVGLHICEDSWFPERPETLALRDLGLSVLVNLSASPFHRGKTTTRENILSRTAAAVGAPLAYCNLVGGQDELVFDGGSLVLLPDGTRAGQANRFREDLLLVDLPVPRDGELLDAPLPADVDWVFLSDPLVPGGLPLSPRPPAPPPDDLREVYEALCLGLRDYADKNGFREVLVAISGGIDSALVATLAVDALGADRVHGISLPTRFSSEGTRNDALRLADNLGIPMPMLPIQDLFEDFLGLLRPQWEGRGEDVTEENLQARIRGNIVMALSNKFGRLVLTTGNKSELATGYCTLYGDMCGGFAVIKDLPKTLVFDVCRWINRQAGRERIPAETITRAPSAELRDNQKDSDSLPPYDVLDAILERYVERDQGLHEIVAAGHDPAVVARVIRLVDLNEYKRRQAAPGIKITPKAFGRDRRMPITNQYRSLWTPPPEKSP